jgi:hypothetical protein
LICDVANQGALWNNPDAHNYVRLYFRPRNSYHLKTEGVKAIGDPYRVNPHISMPVAFAFVLPKVITLPGSGFVPGNFAKSTAAPLTGDAAFDTMPFDLIYHDAAFGPDKKDEVLNWRMSEVVVEDQLSLSHLSCVICRTVHEERTLRYALGNQILPTILVEQKGSIFMRRGMFVDEVFWASGNLHLKFHGPTVFPKDRYAMKVICWDGGVQREGNFQIAPGYYRFTSMPASEDAIWQIELEGCVIYRAEIPSMSLA